MSARENIAVDVSSTEASTPWKAYQNTGADLPLLWFVGWLRPCIRAFYGLRWRVVYPFQRRVDIGKIWLTLGEILVVLPVFVLLVYYAGTQYVNNSYSKALNNTGWAASYVVALTLSTACHNSIWTLLLGIPFERALRYHMMFGRLTIVLSILHMFRALRSPNGEWTPIDAGSSYFFEMKVSGIVFVSAMFLMTVLAAPPIRRKHFEAFYFSHVFFFVVAAGAGWKHGGFFGPGFVLWAIDVVVRLAYMAMCRYPRNATLEALPADVTRVRFPKGAINYKAGQYVWICIPAVSLWEWHPFSISSAPHEEHVTLHCRALGNWTKQLHRYASQDKNKTIVDTRILMEGPAGAPAVDLDSNRYRMVLCVSGGIGITPMQSITNDLMHQCRQGRPLKSLYFVWSVRDKAMIQAMDKRSGKQDAPPPPPGVAAGTAIVHSPVQTHESTRISDDSETSRSSSSRLPTSFQPDLLHEHASALGAHAGDDAGARSNSSTQGVLHTEFYLTKVRDKSEFDAAGIAPDAQKHVRFGRPDLKAIFARMREEARKANETRIAALVCGPSAMVSIVQSLSQTESKDGVTFDFHCEEFEF